ncbi:porin MspA [Gordonia effusa NBRC 100432]|uniref:Porin MspA n=1 Tax=Gordonia effusa NBRC 100432 TaxID=1077974 RepID=H0QY58_9ACTN|nr:MspA family porin [Gordonia effusa]GAB17759.1 porin MspA [Gordonia effusa NBRC 100432]
MKRLVTSATLALTAMLALAFVVVTPALGATKTTSDGHQVAITAQTSKVRSGAPLDSNPMTKEAFITSDFRARISNIAKDKKLKAKVVVGYQFGYPVSVAPDGVTVTLHTPDLKLKGGLNAKVSPSVDIAAAGPTAKIGSDIGAEIGAESTIIPAADFEFKVAPGKISEVKTGEISMTEPEIELFLDGVQFSVTGAVGPVSVRPFATITVTTAKGLYVLNAYGNTRRV